MTQNTTSREEFAKKFPHHRPGCEVGIDPFRDDEDCVCMLKRSEVKSYFNSLLDELLSEVGENVSKEIDNGTWDMARGVNQERSRVRAIINNKKLT